MTHKVSEAWRIAILFLWWQAQQEVRHATCEAAPPLLRVCGNSCSRSLYGLLEWEKACGCVTTVEPSRNPLRCYAWRQGIELAQKAKKFCLAVVL